MSLLTGLYQLLMKVKEIKAIVVIEHKVGVITLIVL